jgi:hypothetical protein
MNVKVLGACNIRDKMNNDRKALSKEHTIFVQEEVVQDEEVLSKARSDVNSNIYCKLLSFDEVIPLGFSAENAITCLKNQGYHLKPQTEETRKGYNKFKHHVYHFNKPLEKYFYLKVGDKLHFLALSCMEMMGIWRRR